MDPLIETLLLVGALAAIPYALIFINRKRIPPGALWATLLFMTAFPGPGWLAALWVALKDWPEQCQDS